MSADIKKVNIVGGGLAGSEAAWQLAKRGIPTTLYEMKPKRFSNVHKNNNLAELVCSNSLGSMKFPHASFLLKEEMRVLESLIVEAAHYSRVPSGKALAVDREIFSQYVTGKLESLKTLEIRREEVTDFSFDDLTLVATGPLTSDRFSKSIRRLVGDEFLYFYDAVSPIVDGSTIDMSKAFFGSRYESGSEDYLNIPLTRNEYYQFVDKLKSARVIPLEEPDDERFFEGCLPIEEMVKRGDDTLAFGPMKPVGFEGKRIGDNFYAVLQLRRENRNNSMFNIVGFQTRMPVSEQKIVFNFIPGFSEISFLRYGKMHRNTYINSRKLLVHDFSLSGRSDIYFCGQITGVEGYIESAASGLAVSLYIAARMRSSATSEIPKTTMIGALLDYVTNKDYGCRDFQPMNANYGIIKQHYPVRGIKQLDEKAYMFKNSLEAMNLWYKADGGFCSKVDRD